MTRKITDEEMQKWESAIKNALEAKVAETINQKSSIKNKKSLKPSPQNLVPKLDLHGLTLNDALAAVQEFMYTAYLAERKKITIITGRSGQIYREFPLWLERDDISPLIHSFAPESKTNTGAWVVKLRN